MATLDLGRITTFSRGAWASGQTYNLLDEVLYEGSSYVSIASTSYVSSSATRPTTASGQASYWRKIASGFAHKGNYDAATAYDRDNIVLFGGNAYRAISNTTAGTLPTDTNSWQQFTSGIGIYLGEYDSTQAYVIGSFVVFDVNNTNNINALFRANQAVSAGETPSSAVAKWDLIVAGFAFLGEWQTSTAYAFRSVVTWHGRLYLSTGRSGSPQNETPNTLTTWTQLSDGFNFIGTLESKSSADALYPGDTVTYANALYQVKTATNGADTPRVSPAKYNVLTSFFDYAGAYSSSAVYYPDQIVVYLNSLYRVVSQTTAGDTPVSASAKFEVFIASPDDFQDYNATNKSLQLKGLTTTQNNAVRGNRELVCIVDGSGNSTGELRLHDGSTTGGQTVSGSSSQSNTITEAITISSGVNKMYFGDTTFSNTVTVSSGGYMVVVGGHANFTSTLNVQGTLYLG